MEELEIISSFNPLVALQSISQIYSVKQLSKVELLRIQTDTQKFNRWLSEQRHENEVVREDMLEKAENYRKYLDRIIDMILQNPDTTALYHDYFGELLRANNDLLVKISDIRIRNK